LSHTITDKTKMTVTQVSGTIDTIDAQIQTALRALANGDKIVSINTVMTMQKNVIAYITYEDQ
jgi:hypothetical protein